LRQADFPWPVQLNDLHQFNPRTLEWNQILPTEVSGIPPSVRVGFGFASANGKLFVYGGKSTSGLYEKMDFAYVLLFVGEKQYSKPCIFDVFNLFLKIATFCSIIA
jgi:hypothetical protein